MFDRFIRLAKAGKALREQRFEEALGLALDPLICADRRAERIREAAAAALLARAGRHLEGDDFAAARADALRLAALAPGAAVDDLCRRVDAAAAGAAAARDLARRDLAEARRLLERGESAAAAALLATVDPSLLLLEHKQVEQLLRERARQAERFCTQAAAALAAGDLEAAVGGLERARGLDRDLPAAAAIASRLAAAVEREASAAVAERLAAGDECGAATQLAAALARAPGLDLTAALRPLRQQVADALVARLQSVDSLAVAVELVAAVARAGCGDDARFAELAAAVAAAAAAPSGSGIDAARQLATAAARFGAVGLLPTARELALAATAREQQLAAAQRHVERGELEAARLELLRLLAEDPGHEAARHELGLVDQGLADLVRRLESARASAQAGRLREACTLGLPLVGSDRVGAEAQQLVADVRARMALVDRGLGEVRVALHGRLAAGVEGVRHCLGRLQELAKIQTDHVDLPGLLQAVETELSALGHCEAAAAALARRALDDAAQAIAALQDLRGGLLSRDRLEARIEAFADSLLVAGEQALSLGRLAVVEQCADLFDALDPQRPDYAARASELRTAAQRRRDAAALLVASATACLQQRDLAEAERLAEAAQAQWQDGPAARRLAAELAELRQQTAALARVEAMARDHDFVGAQHQLAALPPTQAMLRTRIYDMKRDLARAQGLEGAFLLRVDEGGEQLVLRGESVTIGNIRQRRADLPVLANLAGRHASVRRSMSFHGGMQDTIVAEEGDVRVDGAPTPSRQLAPGDRVTLGPAFTFVYQRPSERSLTAALLLQSGFQVAGTDRILLMKDRGRDGRILLGAGRDVHVRVPNASGEVEVYASSGGQMRVHCAGDGTIDGVRFRGEHPVSAGQVVEAAGISFVLYPWQPA